MNGKRGKFYSKLSLNWATNSDVGEKCASEISEIEWIRDKKRDRKMESKR